MQNLINYMEKLGVNYRPEQFGASYFYNVPELHFDGAIITLTAGEINAPAWRQLNRYCARWGYSLKPSHGAPGLTFYTVLRQSDRDALATYTDYMQKSFDACTKAIHLRREGLFSDMSDKEFNEYLTGIMDFWGEELKGAVAA